MYVDEVESLAAFLALEGAQSGAVDGVAMGF